MNKESLPSSVELKNDMLDYNLNMVQRLQEDVGILNVSLEPDYIPIDEEMSENEADMYYESFCTSMTIGSMSSNEDIYIDQGSDVFKFIAQRFDMWSDCLTESFRRSGNKKEANLIGTLTLSGAADFAKNRFNQYLKKFSEGGVGVEQLEEESKKAVYWSWQYLVIDRASEA